MVLKLILSVLILAAPAIAKEEMPTSKNGADGPKKWMTACESESGFSHENAVKLCQCVWDKVGPENVPPLSMLRESHADIVDGCTTAGPKPWIKKCIADSKMGKEAATQYCQCIWDKIGPENVPPLDVLSDMSPDTLAACKK